MNKVYYPIAITKNGPFCFSFFPKKRDSANLEKSTPGLIVGLQKPWCRFERIN